MNALFCPVCEQTAAAFLPFGVKPRRNARCPNCGSLERHRLVWLYLCRHSSLFDGRRKRILHVAPEFCLRRKLQLVANFTYISADLDARKAAIQMDLTEIPFKDNYFDVFYCSHVLEHIPRDRAALQELYRVLSPDGWGIVMVPITAPFTWEDPTILDPIARERAFGQSDHVRRYGTDFPQRLQQAGFSVQRLPASDMLSDKEMSAMAINHAQVLFLCGKYATG